MSNNFTTLCRYCFLTAVLLCFAAGVQAQDEDGDVVVRVSTEFVEVPITILGGGASLNLKIENITVLEDGVKQEIEGFRSAAAPFEVALLLDTSGSARAELELIKRSAAHFIDSLRPGDKVALIGFNTSVAGGRANPVGEVLSELTDDRRKLKLALEKLSVSNGTPYYDTLLKIADEVFDKGTRANSKGRRAMVLLTDGVDSTSSAGFPQVYGRLDRLGAAVYFIKVDTQEFFEDNLLGNCIGAMRFSAAQIRRYYAGFKNASELEQISDFCKLGDFERLDISRRMYEAAEYEMNLLADTSGGRIFPVGSHTEARTAFASVAAELGTVYSIGYYSSNSARDGKFRKIGVEIKGLPPEAKVRARTGYYAGK